MQRSRLAAQRGAILVITLVILVAMTLASIALFRSVDTAVLLSANIGFKRDAMTSASSALRDVLTKMVASDFIDATATYGKDLAKGQNTRHYSPVVLETRADGVPVIMTNKTTFDEYYPIGSGTAAGVELRYLIERMCDQIGSPSDEHCTYSDGAGVGLKDYGDYRGGKSQLGGKAGTAELPLFRVTVRADGARNTVAYVQSFVALK
jgi:type IV pilus assembly protein PilX